MKDKLGQIGFLLLSGLIILLLLPGLSLLGLILWIENWMSKKKCHESESLD